MSISEDTVRQVAKLSGLAVSEDEVPKMATQLGEILEYVEQLSNVNTHGVPPTSHVHGVVNAFREDIVKASLTVEEALQNAPDGSPAGFRVPKII